MPSGMPLRFPAAHITTWEHPPPLALLGWLLRCQRQAEPKRRSLPWRTLDAHLSLMLLNDGATNMQSQAESDPSATLDLDPLGAVEAFPDLLLFLWRQTWALQHGGAFRFGLTLPLDRPADDGAQASLRHVKSQPAPANARDIHQIVDEPFQPLSLAFGLRDRRQEEFDIYGICPLTPEQAPNTPLDKLQSKLHAHQRVFELVPSNAQEALHLCRGLAQGCFLRLVYAPVFNP